MTQTALAKKTRQAYYGILVTTGTRKGFSGLDREAGVFLVAQAGVLALALLCPPLAPWLINPPLICGRILLGWACKVTEDLPRYRDHAGQYGEEYTQNRASKSKAPRQMCGRWQVVALSQRLQ